jgi:hypothetical protein
MSSPLIRLASVGALALAAGACSKRTLVVMGPEPAAAVVVANRDEGRGPLGVPPGHLPRRGECRVWFPGRPPGHQPAPGPCRQVQRDAPAGAWVLYSPERDGKVVHARVIDARRAGVVVAVRVYDSARGTYLRDERP